MKTLGIIDDNYKQEGEDIDNTFMKSLEDGKKKKAVIKKYLKDLHKSKKKYENRYHRHLIIKKWKIWHKLKKIKRKPRYKHLKIKHFKFEFNLIEKLKISFNIFFFNIKRFFLRGWMLVIPKIFLYVYYKVTKMIKSTYGNTKDSIDQNKKDTKEKLTKFFTMVLAKIKKIYVKIMKKIKKVLKKIKKILKKIRKTRKRILKKVIFWEKPKEEEGDEEEEDEEEEDEEEEDEEEEGAEDKKEESGEN